MDIKKSIIVLVLVFVMAIDHSDIAVDAGPSIPPRKKPSSGKIYIRNTSQEENISLENFLKKTFSSTKEWPLDTEVTEEVQIIPDGYMPDPSGPIYWTESFYVFARKRMENYPSIFLRKDGVPYVLKLLECKDLADPTRYHTELCLVYFVLKAEFSVDHSPAVLRDALQKHFFLNDIESVNRELWRIPLRLRTQKILSVGSREIQKVSDWQTFIVGYDTEGYAVIEIFANPDEGPLCIRANRKSFVGANPELSISENVEHQDVESKQLYTDIDEKQLYADVEGESPEVREQSYQTESIYEELPYPPLDSEKLHTKTEKPHTETAETEYIEPVNSKRLNP